jgi:hypothetical protein
MNALAALPDGKEVNVLAREIAGAFRARVEGYKRHYSAKEALAMAQEPVPREVAEMILARPPEEVSWSDLHDLTAGDSPDAALCRWGEIKRDACEDLQTGHRAAKVVEGGQGSPWERAQYAALYQELAAGWQPRNGIERQLIETLALAQTKVLFWLACETMRSTMQAASEKQGLKERGVWEPPRVSDFDAVEQAAAMADRYNRLFLRTLRALCNLRKVPLAVVVQNAGQVNVGGQQVNVAASFSGE